MKSIIVDDCQGNILLDKISKRRLYPLEETYSKILRRLARNRYNVVASSTSDPDKGRRKSVVVIQRLDETHTKMGVASRRDGDKEDSRFGFHLALARAMGATDLERDLLNTNEIQCAVFD